MVDVGWFRGRKDCAKRCVTVVVKNEGTDIHIWQNWVHSRCSLIKTRYLLHVGSHARVRDRLPNNLIIRDAAVLPLECLSRISIREKYYAFCTESALILDFTKVNGVLTYGLLEIIVARYALLSPSRLLFCSSDLGMLCLYHCQRRCSITPEHRRTYPSPLTTWAAP